MKLKLILLVLVMLSLVGTTEALGITPPEIIFDFEPPFNQDATLRIYNTEHREMDVTVHIEGPLAKRVIEMPELIHLPADVDYVVVNYTIQIPPGILVSGESVSKIIVSEVPPTSAESSISSVLSVAGKITLLGQFPGKHVRANLIVEDSSGTNDEVIFKINAKNYGIEDVEKLSAEIDVFTPADQSVETVKLPESGVGAYQTFVTLFYDGELLDLTDDFRVGWPYVGIDRAVAEKELGTTKFNLATISNWNERMHDVHAEILITDQNDIIIDDLKTDFYVVEPFGENSLSLESKEINTDEDLKVKVLIFYDNRNTLKEYSLNELLDARKAENLKIIAVILGIIIILTLLSFKFFKSKGKFNFRKYINQHKILRSVMKEAKYGR